MANSGGKLQKPPMPLQRTASPPKANPASFERQVFDLSAVPIHPPGGRPLSSSERSWTHPAFARDFSSVRVHESTAAPAVDADAVTIGNEIHFAPGAYDPTSVDGRELLAHELVHVAQQDGSPTQARRLSSPSDGAEIEADQVAARVASGAAAGAIHQSVGAGTISRKKRPASKRYPWIGRIANTWSAALRSAPHKDDADPHAGTVADLEAGRHVKVLGKTHGWYQVEATVDGKDVRGYVSHELVEFVRWDPMPLGDALVTLKRAETKLAADPWWSADAGEDEQIVEATESVDDEPRYAVDKGFRVAFAKSKNKIKILTIEDFILFVEAVEAQYPSASPEEIVSEIRQIWFSDLNWELMVASKGIQQKGTDVNIESEPDPIAVQFDTNYLQEDGRFLQTPMGKVDISHVLAGLDARLSGYQSTYPKDYLEAHGRNTGEAKFKYEALKQYSGGDATWFSTVSGDLGQAYASYLHARYDKNDSTAKLSDYMDLFSKPAELRGDIHGYIAAQVAKDERDAGQSSTGKAATASSILRDLYLSPKSKTSNYYDYLRTVSGHDSTALHDEVFNAAMMFAHIWYAKLAADDTTNVDLPADMFDDFIKRFAELSDKQEASGSDTLEGVVQDVLSNMSLEKVR